MSLYADICRDTFADEDEIDYDRRSKTWTIPPQWGLDRALTGVPSKEMALAICRALYASWVEGGRAAGHS